MTIDIKKLAKLSNLYLSPEEEKILVKDIDGILHWAEHLQDISIEEARNALDQGSCQGKAPIREDQVSLKETSTDILANAPQVKDDLFVVPLVVGEC
jgi:aspartyl/glutamyl-tRNA(Asn/Gln) amidotransferase C subunit